jgi:hypothetical protein
MLGTVVSYLVLLSGLAFLVAVAIRFFIFVTDFVTDHPIGAVLFMVCIPIGAIVISLFVS